MFYIDIRAFGKGFEELYGRSRRLGVQFIRGLPGSVEETAGKGLRVAVENSATSTLEFHELDSRLRRCFTPAVSSQCAPGAGYVFGPGR